MGPGGAYLPRDVYVDGSFSAASLTRVLRKRLLVTSELISWRDNSMEFYRVTALAYWVMPVKATTGQLIAYIYNVSLLSNETRFSVSLYGPKKDNETPLAFQNTVAALRTHVEPRLLRDALTRIDTGEQVKVGPLTFSREGVFNKGFMHNKSATWSSRLEVHPSALGTGDASTQHIYVRDDRDGRRKIGEISSNTPNGVLLTAIVDFCVSRYSTG